MPFPFWPPGIAIRFRFPAARRKRIQALYASLLDRWRRGLRSGVRPRSVWMSSLKPSCPHLRGLIRPPLRRHGAKLARWHRLPIDDVLGSAGAVNRSPAAAQQQDVGEQCARFWLCGPRLRDRAKQVRPDSVAMAAHAAPRRANSGVPSYGAQSRISPANRRIIAHPPRTVQIAGYHRDDPSSEGQFRRAMPDPTQTNH